MSGRSPGPAGTRCLLILQRSLAIQLHKVPSTSGKNAQQPVQQPAQNGTENSNSEYWMYDSGYLLFQSFLEANCKCFWNASLREAMQLLQFQGYVAPGVLLVSANACVLEVVRAAWARNVLKPPTNYAIALVGDIDDCVIQPLSQGQFTPLPEALCWVILELTSAGEPAMLDKIRATLAVVFPAMQRPSSAVVYDALAKLSADRKVYQTAQGYFVVTPERRRRDSASRTLMKDANDATFTTRPLLMSPDEAMAMVHGEMTTIRDGEVTHQAVQTNLADVICGGNANDKVLYARSPRRSSSFPAGRLERRHSLRLFGSARRLSSPSRSARHVQSSSSSSAEGPSSDSTQSPKKASLLSRLFRRSKRGASVPPLATFSAQFPPPEWFNPRVAHMHSVGTQTAAPDHSMASLGLTWTDDDDAISRAATLPRPRRRRELIDPLATPSRRRSPSIRSCTLPRGGSMRSVELPRLVPSAFSPCKSSSTTLSSKASHRSLAGSVNDAVKGSSRAPSNDSTYGSKDFSRSSKALSLNSSSSKVSSRDSEGNRRSPLPDFERASFRNGLGSFSEKRSPKLRARSQHSGTLNGDAGYHGSIPDSRSSSRCSPNRAAPVPMRNGLPNKPLSPRVADIKARPPSKNSITLQVSTNRKSQSIASDVTSGQSPSSSVTVKSESPDSSTTTTTTINGSNTKIFVQQQNSPVRSLITFENGLRRGKKDVDDILIVNEPERSDKENFMTNGFKEVKRHRPKLERPTSLYSPREVIKTGFATEAKIKPEVVRRFPSVESLTCSETTITNSEEGVPVPVMAPLKTMNNTRKLSNSEAASLSAMGKDGLSYKNIFGTDSPYGSKNAVTSPDKTFDSTGSFNNLFVANGDGEGDKLRANSRDFSSAKNLVEMKENGKSTDLGSFPSLGDLSVSYKSLAAQKILSGISINSVDTLVEVNMAAAEKQNNCDVTLHTDFGLV